MSIKRLLIVLIVLLVSVWIGATIATDPGYVLIVYKQWTIESPLWFTIILLILFFIALYGLARLWKSIRKFPRKFQGWSLQQKSHNERKLAKFAINVAQMNIFLEQKQWEEALNLLKKMSPFATERAQNLGARKILPAEKIINFEIQIYQGLLMQSMQDNDQSKLIHVWNRMPRNLRQQPMLVKVYAKALIEHHADDEAEKILHKVLSKSWHDDLVYLYGVARSSKASRQLVTAEGWLKDHPDNAVLLLTLGRLCMRNQLWGKARSYFEASLSCAAHAESRHELAKLLDRLGESAAARDSYAKGLELALSSKKSPSFSA